MSSVFSKLGIVKSGLCTLLVLTAVNSCVPVRTVREPENMIPEQYSEMTSDTLNSVKTRWKSYFSDPALLALIDTALVHNRELNAMAQRVEMAKNEVRARKGEYLPSVSIMAGAEVEKVGRYTSQGANDANTEIREGEEFPEPLPDFMAGAFATWELDVWKKLRNAKKAAVFEYLATVEGKNFMITNLVAEIADNYYELQALDNQLAIIDQNLHIQQDALAIVKLQKEAARATELAVRRFEAELLKNRKQKYELLQAITEMENRLNLLLGRKPQQITRNSGEFVDKPVDSIQAGIPAQLLQNRPDIRQAEYELAAARLDVKVARANFYPSIGIRAGGGLEAFNTRFLTTTPESVFYRLAGDLVAPLINRNALKAAYNNASARQIEAVFEYERTILNAYFEVANQLSNIENLRQSFDLKERQVQALTESIDLSNRLFQSARADYMEVLLTQRDALESRMELVETRRDQLLAKVAVYRALGGGWN